MKPQSGFGQFLCIHWRKKWKCKCIHIYLKTSGWRMLCSKKPLLYMKNVEHAKQILLVIENEIDINSEQIIQCNEMKVRLWKKVLLFLTLWCLTFSKKICLPCGDFSVLLLQRKCYYMRFQKKIVSLSLRIVFISLLWCKIGLV